MKSFHICFQQGACFEPLCCFFCFADGPETNAPSTCSEQFDYTVYGNLFQGEHSDHSLFLSWLLLTLLLIVPQMLSREQNCYHLTTQKRQLSFTIVKYFIVILWPLVPLSFLSLNQNFKKRGHLERKNPDRSYFLGFFSPFFFFSLWRKLY